MLYENIEIDNPSLLARIDTEGSVEGPRFGTHPLPSSYKAFMRQFGYGRILGLIFVLNSIPEHPDSLWSQGRRIQGFIRQAVDEEYIEHAPDGSNALVDALYPFAMSENGEYFAWDIRELVDGEYPIYCIASRMCGVTFAANNMYQLLDTLSSDGIKNVMGTGYAPLPRVFRASADLNSDGAVEWTAP